MPDQPTRPRVAVIGASGNIGARVVRDLGERDVPTVSVSRRDGVDVITGEGLDAALAGVTTILDVSSTAAIDRDGATEFFGTVATNLIAAGQRAGVRHYLLLSIVGIDRVEGNGHYAGKRRQEQVVTDGPLPWTIQRATQFFDFPATVAGWLTQDGRAALPPLLLQPVSGDDVAEALAELATAAPAGRVADLAGPETHDFVDLARRTLTARGERVALTATWRDVPFGPEMSGEVLLAGADARLGRRRLDDWLAAGAP